MGGDAFDGGNCGGLSGTSILFLLLYKSNTFERVRKRTIRMCEKQDVWNKDTYLVANIIQDLFTHVFNKHVPPLLMFGCSSFPIDNIEIGYFTRQIDHCNCYDFWFPLQAQCCSQRIINKIPSHLDNVIT